MHSNSFFMYHCCTSAIDTDITPRACALQIEANSTTQPLRGMGYRSIRDACAAPLPLRTDAAAVDRACAAWLDGNVTGSPELMAAAAAAASANIARAPDTGRGRGGGRGGATGCPFDQASTRDAELAAAAGRVLDMDPWCAACAAGLHSNMGG
jgi:hypothetical protein